MIIPQPNTNLIINADCLTALKELLDNSVDSIVTDPPYGLGFMGKQWDTFDKSQFGKEGEEGENDLKVKKNFKILPRYNSDGLYDFTNKWAKECLRVLKPGGFLLSFSGTRTYHKICMGIEDAGFEIRDMISWLYGSGFPKSLNIGKQVDKMQGNEREVVGENPNHRTLQETGTMVGEPHSGNGSITKGNSDWEGWGTALKPACEPIVVARKPLSEKNVALNVLKWGTGGINIDGCRIESNGEHKRPIQPTNNDRSIYGKQTEFKPTNAQGRFPANIILDEEAGKILDKQTGELKSGSMQKGMGGFGNGEKNCYGESDGAKDSKEYNCSNGGASRFFYCAKAGKKERNLGCEEFESKAKCEIDKMGGEKCSMKTGSGNDRNVAYKNNHPTVKPVKLMQYLVRLVTPKGKVCLDPFFGSGTTGIACIKEGMNYIGIEREADYIKIANARIKAIESSHNLKRGNNE